jgi:hypothetical protein
MSKTALSVILMLFLMIISACLQVRIACSGGRDPGKSRKIMEEEEVDYHEVQIVVRVLFITGAGAYGDDVSECVLVVRSGCLKSPVQTHNKYVSRVLVR